MQVTSVDPGVDCLALATPFTVDVLGRGAVDGDQSGCVPQLVLEDGLAAGDFGGGALEVTVVSGPETGTLRVDGAAELAQLTAPPTVTAGQTVNVTFAPASISPVVRFDGVDVAGVLVFQDSASVPIPADAAAGAHELLFIFPLTEADACEGVAACDVNFSGAVSNSVTVQ